jgi:hypothetical protein
MVKALDPMILKMEQFSDNPAIHPFFSEGLKIYLNQLKTKLHPPS